MTTFAVVKDDFGVLAEEKSCVLFMSFLVSELLGVVIFITFLT